MTAHFTREPEHISMLRDTVRRFVAEHLPADLVHHCDQTHSFPRDVFAELMALGVGGLTVDTAYGGQGRDLMAAIVVIEELCQAGSVLAGPYIHCAFYGGVNISENGSRAQKDALLPPLARGELLFAYGLSEPDVGGDLASVRTRARKTPDGNHMILNGSKRWCTGADWADYIICLTNSDDQAPKYQNLTLVLVPKGTPGISIQPIEHMNLRYTASCDVTFDDVELPIEQVLGGPDMWNQGWKTLAGEALEVEKLEITAVAYGVARAVVDEAWSYAEERVQFDQPISAHQAVRHALADARTKLKACQHMLYHAVWLANSGQPCAVESSMAKLFVAETAVEIGMTCQRVLGAYGLSDGFHMARNVRDLLGMPIVGGSSNMQRNNIANRLRLAN